MDWLKKLRSPALPISDEEAMRRVQCDGDHAAFGQLLRRWEAPIQRLCTRMTDDPHLGEDLSQEAFSRVFACRHQFQDGRKFSTWLWRIAINLCRDNGRRAGRVSESSDELDENPTPLRLPDEQLIDDERSGLVRRALASLPENQRAVVILREYEGLRFREIAEVLNAPEGTVKSRMADALAELSRQLTPILGDESARGPRAARQMKARLV
jgi:RNA polymerase sigma-70 factor (ECF subfamily)